MSVCRKNWDSDAFGYVINGRSDCTHAHTQQLMYSLSAEEILIELISSIEVAPESEFGTGLLSYCCHINLAHTHREKSYAPGRALNLLIKSALLVCD